jgi:hypothetical protein
VDHLLSYQVIEQASVRPYQVTRRLANQLAELPAGGAGAGEATQALRATEAPATWN